MNKVDDIISVFDAAQYVLTKLSDVPAMKLQKLMYYCQAWSLVWDEKPLFPEDIQAWAQGPAIPALYERHKGQFKIDPETILGNCKELKDWQKETIDAVLETYGSKPSQWLNDLTHMEDPWKNARRSLSPRERGNQIISWNSMAEYYGSL